MKLEKELYTVKEVASLLAVSDETVRRWLKNDTLQGIKVGQGKGKNIPWRITKDAILKVLNPSANQE
jgi:excisionase family DNA binding protein